MGLQQSSPAGMARPSRAGKVRSREERAQRDGAVTASPHATQLLDGAAAQLRQLCSDWERATHGTEEQQDESARTLLAEVDEVLAMLECAAPPSTPASRASWSPDRAAASAFGELLHRTTVPDEERGNQEREDDDASDEEEEEEEEEARLPPRVPMPLQTPLTPEHAQHAQHVRPKLVRSQPIRITRSPTAMSDPLPLSGCATPLVRPRSEEPDEGFKKCLRRKLWHSLDEDKDEDESERDGSWLGAFADSAALLHEPGQRKGCAVSPALRYLFEHKERLRARVQREQERHRCAAHNVAAQPEPQDDQDEFPVKLPATPYGKLWQRNVLYPQPGYAQPGQHVH
jgi:hypothetical protein